ncbi:DUF1513 domain-containing protein [Photobacterium halotolerans]|uniref:Lipoprotein n=1 Tax=Photobacterium halotolerans TaxID=265726 RepID=A0A0F5VFX0_9GAMM|nr:DUF1513 domain-containing protein [Photobacterium halotolerans]KKD00702.1 hypothetical protein KY46_06250 [Photobacterium halotolerans]
MQPMVTDLTRRALLKKALGTAILLPTAGILSACASADIAREPLTQGQLTGTENCDRLIGCSRTPDGRYAVVVADAHGRPIHQIALPERGHGVAIQPGGALAVAFARRPGAYMQAFYPATGEMLPLRRADQNRHYYGHGAFSADGRYLFATEGVSTTSEGVIGVYDTTAGLQKVAEYTGFGIGPHEVVLADPDTLAIGVGGVHTLGREPFNLDTMQPALVYLDIQSGQVVEKAVLSDKRLSIRHLAVTDTGDIACGQQYRGLPDQAAPLVHLHTRGSELRPLLADEEDWMRFNHYIASIASLDGYLLATSPRGNCYGIWREATGALVDLQPLTDASGVAVSQGQWLVGSGAGKILTRTPLQPGRIDQSAVMWDNHWKLLFS